jgi:hypothetical protein
MLRAWAKLKRGKHGNSLYRIFLLQRIAEQHEFVGLQNLQPPAAWSAVLQSGDPVCRGRASSGSAKSGTVRNTGADQDE